MREMKLIRIEKDRSGEYIIVEREGKQYSVAFGVVTSFPENITRAYVDCGWKQMPMFFVSAKAIEFFKQATAQQVYDKFLKNKM